ncbi:MAG: aldo/keto reductase [Anaerolineales bacterium]|nr:aldo/keto reductase [Anaerolineales bacterium]
MNYRQLGTTEFKVSSIGLGCVTFGREIDEATSFAVMDHAVAAGINLFDTAEAYAAGASETVVGHWLGQSGQREQIVLATKVATNLTRERVLSSAEASLNRLQTEVIDLFQVHHWDAKVPLAETLGALNELVSSGKVRQIGCSNYTAAQLAEALALQRAQGWQPFVSVQPNYNLVVRDIEAEMLPLCAKEQIGVLSFSPLGAGFLTGKYRRGGEIPAGTRFDIIPAHQDIYFSDENFAVVEDLRAASTQLDIPMPQLAMAWVIDRPHITSVLIGARSTAHVDQAFKAEQLASHLSVREALAHF